ncbi:MULTISPECIES: hypothetical protein [Marinobacter]|uniref:Uncharacterized protein n=1 Tax=Marinobacter nauticus (strain ATCC 700491 / DSM 11845 / VT8) TaxID=351348 RepID=A1U7S9_MARN8|nr:MULTISPECIES: hypothetical protein [Marinobacter]ABM21048.1 hypothetical protein Maqu_4197 [Marinobacter nauticus VT8]
MKTPRLFSTTVAQKLLPQTLGKKFQPLAMKLAAATGHQCQVSGYPYPLMKSDSSSGGRATPLMIEPRDTDEHGQPLSARAIQERLQKLGVTPKTVQVVCPLIYWSKHVDLAINYKRGSLIFAPWASQGELITLFRTLAVADSQPKGDHHIPTLGRASEAMLVIEEEMGNHGILSEVLALPEDTEWDAQVWLDTLRRLPARERRIYQQRFAQHLRFWPSADSFRPLFGYWGSTAHKNPNQEDRSPTSTGNPWIKRYSTFFEQALSENSR